MVDSSTPSSCNFLSQYRSINNKLKKRFMRKPNVAECSEQFGQLAILCQTEEVPQYAGLCYLAVAHCESQLNNLNDEAWAYVNAGWQFLKGHMKDETIGLLSPGGDEKLQSALSSFQSAENIWKKSKFDTPLAASLNLQIAETLQQLDEKVELSAEYFDRAAKLLNESPHLQLYPLTQLASCKLQIGHYDVALDVFNQVVDVIGLICEEPFGVYSEIILRCEICRIMLLLLLRPPPQLLTQSMTAVLERYSWLEDNYKSPVDWMSDDLFLLLQSLVMACQAKDAESLRFLEGDLWKYLDNKQRDLLRSLVEVVAADCDK